MALKLSLCLWIPSAMAFVLAKPLILAVLFSRHTSATAGPTAALLTMYLPAFLGLCVRDTFAMIAVAMDRAGQAAQIGIAGVLLSLLTKVFVLHPFSLGRCAMITGCFSLAVALATAVAVGRGGGLKWRKGPVWTLKLSVVSALAVGIGIVATPVIGGGPSVVLPFVAAFLVFCVGCAVTGILPLRHLLAKVCLGA
jgi:peptidoglycan biosynthesis protein MviN/MurJ (putative lipid II flippase)